MGTRLHHIAHGVLDVYQDGTFSDRLVHIDDGLEAIIREYKPDAGAVESLFFAKDAQSAAKLGHARGIVLLRLARAHVDTFEYAPRLIKKSITGRGAAEKKQVAMVIRALLKLEAEPRADAADALAVAMTHLNLSAFSSLANQAPAHPELVRAAKSLKRRPRLKPPSGSERGKRPLPVASD